MSEPDHTGRLILDRAVERVRAAAMDMRSTGDLRRVVAVLYGEMLDLGIETPAASITLVDESAAFVHSYVGVPRPSLDWSVKQATCDVVTVGDNLALESGSRDLAEWLAEHDERPAPTWGSCGRTQTYEHNSTREAPALGKILGLNEGEQLAVHEAWTGHWSVTNVPFSAGMIGYRERQHHPEHDDMVAELARGLELGFRRFLDFQQLERQNRELEIERSLERLRTAIAGMERSGGVSSLRDQLQAELEALGVPCGDGVGINTWDTATQILFLSGKAVARVDLENGMVGWPDRDDWVPITGIPMIQSWTTHWSQRQTYVRQHTSVERAADLQAMLEADLVTEVDVTRMREAGGQDDIWVVDVFFEHGSLAMNKLMPEPFADEHVRLLERFTEVFALGYRRHLELQDAENRARQAEIDRAVETVRAAAEGMRQSTDLQNLCTTLKDSLIDVGVPVRHLSINILDEDKSIGWAYSASSVMEADGGLRDGWDEAEEYFERWKQGGLWQRQWTAEQNRHLIEYIRTKTEDEGSPVPSEFSEDWAATDRWVVDAFFSHGAVALDRPAPDPFSDTDIDTIQRLTAVFAVGYRRHLELKAAEDRAHRAEIDLGVERVRAASMGMDNSDDLPGVVGTVYREMHRLGVTARCVAINFVEEEAGEIDVWSVYPLVSTDDFRLRFRREDAPIDIGDDLCGRNYRVPLDSPEWQLALEGWRTGTPSLQSVTADAQAVRESFERHYEGADTLSEDVIEFYTGDYLITNVPFTHGMIGYHGRNLPEDHVETMQALAGALELGYLRYFDLQAAEQRAHEAEVERALERVRTTIAAMRTRDDLAGLVVTVKAELDGLDVLAHGLGINTVNAETGLVTLRTTRGTQCSVREIAAEDEPSRDVPRWRERLQAGGHWLRTYTAQEVSGYLSAEVERGHLTRQQADQEMAALDDREAYVVDVFFEGGSLALNRATQPFSDDEIALLRRFSDVFALGYRRHLDLTAAEERARQADIDLSIERVRAAAMAMETSAGLPQVVGGVGREMLRLGIERGGGVNFIDPETERIDVWNMHQQLREWGMQLRDDTDHELHIVDDDIFVAHFVVADDATGSGWKTILDAWRTGEPTTFADSFDGERLEAYYRSMLTGSDESFSALAQRTSGPISFGNVPFAYGTIGYRVPGDAAQYFPIVQALAGALELGYLRYFDLQAAEQRARDAELSRARQHVRTVVSAMKSANDIGRVVDVLRDELRGVGVSCDQVGINIIDGDAGTMRTAWNSQVEAAAPLQSPAADAHRIASGNRLIEHWRDGEVWSRPRSDSAAGAIGWVVDVPFEFGTLAMNRGQTDAQAPQFTDDEIAVLQSFADVVSLGYTRFRDFEQLEAQNRQLVIERAVERVRAESATMSRPEDLGKLFVALWEGADEVGCPRPGINIVDEERQVFHVFSQWGDDELYLLELDSDVQLVTRDFLPGMHLIRSGDLPLSLAHEQGWAAPGMESRVLPMADDFPQAMQLLWGYYNRDWEGVVGVPVANVPFAYGGLFGFGRSQPNSEGIVRDEPGTPTVEDLHLLQRFASAVGYGYGRYLELVAAEERIRQLVLDRAVERVRAEATGMRESGDIGKLLLALRQGWSDVGLHTSALGINVIDEDADLLRTYTMVPHLWEDLKSFLVAEVASDAYLLRFRDLPLPVARELGIALPGSQAGVMTKDAQHAVLKQHLLGFDVPDVDDGCPGMRIPFRYGGIWAWADENAVLVEDDLVTGSLFADAVALGYTRYLDLQAAEENARQQAIEAAVERVRGAALAMQSTEDLPQVAAVLKQQLDLLAPASPSLTITYLDRDTGSCLGLSCNANPRAYGLQMSDRIVEIDDDYAVNVSAHTEDDSDGASIIGRVRKLWERGTPDWHVFTSHPEFGPKLGRYLQAWGVDHDEARRVGYLRDFFEATEVHGAYVPFSSGMVGLQMPVRDDSIIPILQELTEALDLGFVRFLDFQRLEEQNRRQAIEGAAERVRAAAMSMASQDDLRNVAGMLFTELRALGIQTPRVSINFHDPRSDQWQAYHTNINPRRFGLEWTAEGLYEYNDEVFSYSRRIVSEEFLETLQKLSAVGEPQTIPRTQTLENLVQYGVNQYGIDPKGLDTNPYLTREWVGDWEITCVPFDYGVLAYHERKHDAASTSVVQELMAALNLGFVRFLDFQRLEEQITRLEEAHQALELANEEIQLANRHKSEFLANMSHELRTPMNAIVGFSKIIHRRAKDQLDKRQVANLERVLQSAEILMTLINDILDLAKIEAGRLDVQPETFDLRELLDSCMSTVSPLMKKGVRLRTRMARSLAPVHTDPARVRQIVINLLSNAAKFTEAGQIRVGLRDTGDRVVISVSDSGIGIPEDKLETIFEEFRQADGSTTRKYGGTGLGLSISRRLAQMLGGDIHVTSVVGEGSTFSVSLPRELSSTAAEADTEATPVSIDAGAGRVVLSIDDDPDVISLITQELEEDGYRVVGAQRALEGIDKAQSLKPHAITLDIMMPGMDGWEAITRLKASPETRDIPIIVVSILDDKERGYRLGADEYLIKPVDRESLGRVLQRYEGRGKQVLITDDDPVVVEMIRQLLEEDRWTVRTAGNGQEALDAIAASRPDVMLLDLMMPVMDGFETLRRVRANPDSADLPVIIVTAKDLAADEEEELRANASRVIEKDGRDRDRILRDLRQAMSTLRSRPA